MTPEPPHLAEPSPEPGARDRHRAERNRNLSWNIAFGLAGRAANALLVLAMVPILVRMLGAHRYGIYVTITAVVGWLQTGALGIGKGVVNSLVAAHAAGDEVEARRYLWSFWAGLAGLTAAAGLLAAGVFPFVPWTSVFPPGSSVGGEEIVRTVAIAIAFTLLALGLAPLGYVFSAYQEERKGTAWAVARAALTLGTLSTALALSPTMPAAALAVGLATVVAHGAGTLWLVLRDKPFLRPRRGDVRLGHLVRASGASAVFLAIDLAAILAYQTDKLIVLQVAGAEPVAEFELAGVGFLLAQSVFGVVVNPLWPAFGEALRRGDLPWARAALSRLVRWSVAGMTAVVVLGVAIGPPAIRLWAGDPAVVPGRPLLLLLGLYFLLRTYTECHTVVLFGLDRQREMLPAIVANGILAVGLGILLGRAWGVVGVALSLGISMGVTQAILVPLRARRLLRDAPG